MDEPRCRNCQWFTKKVFDKNPADTFGRWCDGYCHKDKQYTWFFNGCEKHEWKYGQHEQENV